jgi:microcompartment protein CcmK/EutM
VNLGRVIGTVVASTFYEGLEGVRFLVVQPLNTALDSVGVPLVATDAVQSGPGDIIYYETSREASMGLETSFVPVDACVVGHVDAVGDRSTLAEYSDRGQT